MVLILVVLLVSDGTYVCIFICLCVLEVILSYIWKWHNCGCVISVVTFVGVLLPIWIMCNAVLFAGILVNGGRRDEICNMEMMVWYL